MNRCHALFSIRDKRDAKALKAARITEAALAATLVWVFAACSDSVGVGDIASPNVLIILVDDLRWDALGATGNEHAGTPNIDRLAEQGVMFTQAFVISSLCAPSRATVLTGQRARGHGVVRNGEPGLIRSIPTLPKLLKSAGYATAFAGKWHLGGDGSLADWFDEWLSFSGQGDYTDPLINKNGLVLSESGHITDIITDFSLAFLKRERRRPFFLIVSHKAVHQPVTPQPRFAGSHSSDPVVAPATFNLSEPGKPTFLRLRAISPDTAALVERIRRYRETLAGVDESVGRILEVLTSSELLDRTLVVFTSDNGLLMGEHRLGDKRVAYEESIRIPLIARYPAWFAPGERSDAIVLNLDIAPTVLEAVGIGSSLPLEGQSLRDFTTGEIQRAAFWYEYYRDPQYPVTPSIEAVRTRDWKFIRYTDAAETDELYNLGLDPLETTNLVGQPEYTAIADSLRRQLERLRQ